MCAGDNITTPKFGLTCRQTQTTHLMKTYFTCDVQRDQSFASMEHFVLDNQYKNANLLSIQPVKLKLKKEHSQSSTKMAD